MALIEKDDLLMNKKPRVAVCLLLDVSPSMFMFNYRDTGLRRIEALVDGVKLFYQAIENDEVALDRVDVSVATFWSSQETIQEFTNVEDAKKNFQIDEGSGTYIGEAINYGLDLLESRKAEYKVAGVSYYQPWLVIFTDGEGNGSPSEFMSAKVRIAEMIPVDKRGGKAKLHFIPVCIGSDEGETQLSELSPKLRPIPPEVDYREFFLWLSSTMGAVSNTNTDDDFDPLTLPLPTDKELLGG